MANWGLPLAAMADMKKDVEIISPKMTGGELAPINYNVLSVCIVYMVSAGFVCSVGSINIIA